MSTLILTIVFGVAGALIGDYWFDGSYIIGAVIGVVLALILRFGKAGAAGDTLDFGDFSA